MESCITVDDFARDLLLSALFYIPLDTSLSTNDIPPIPYIQIVTKTVELFRKEFSEDLELLFENNYSLVRSEETDFKEYILKYCGPICKSHIYYDWIFVCTFVVHLIWYSSNSRRCFRYLDTAKKCLIDLFNANFTPEFFHIGGWTGLLSFCYAINILQMTKKSPGPKSEDSFKEDFQFLQHTVMHYRYILGEIMKAIKDDEFYMRVSVKNDQDTSKIRGTDDASRMSTTVENDASRICIAAEDCVSTFYTTTEDDAGRMCTTAEDDASRMSTTVEDDASRMSTTVEDDASRMSTTVEDASRMYTTVQEDASRIYNTIVEDDSGRIHIAENDAGSIHIAEDDAGSIHIAEDDAGSIQISEYDAGSLQMAENNAGNILGILIDSNRPERESNDGCTTVNQNKKKIKKNKSRRERKNTPLKKLKFSAKLESKPSPKTAENNPLKMNIPACKWCGSECLKCLKICINVYKSQYFSFINSVINKDFS